MNDTFTFCIPKRAFKVVGAIVFTLMGLVVGIGISASPATAQAGAVEDTAYTAITPCASFDSRTDTGSLNGQYSHNEIRDFQITGIAPTDQQFGVNCAVPADADAVLINIVAISPTTGGNFRAFATGDTGTGGVVNYAAVSPNLNNSNAVVIPLSSSGEISIQNNCGNCGTPSAHARGIILGYFTDNLAQRVETLEAGNVAALAQRVEDLEDLLEDVTRDNAGPNGTDRLLFTGMNLQLVDGTGDTQCTGDDLNGGTTGSGETCNGEGNLIIGYNDDLFDTRTGVHSLIIGDRHTWTSYGHIIAGSSNRAIGTNSSITAGFFNVADGDFASVTGGNNNNATGDSSSVTGGSSNTASSRTASVTGGRDNTASAIDSSVTGGRDNTARGNQSSVTGGQSNIALDFYSSVTGGQNNRANGDHSSVSGGQNNTAAGDNASISGGLNNAASGPQSSVTGGRNNTASGDQSSVTGGAFNTANGFNSSVTGGTSSTASGGSSSVSGGVANTASGANSSITGGELNNSSGANSTVTGGQNNEAAGLWSTVIGGGSATTFGNEANADRSVIVGGANNTTSGPGWAVVGGGRDNDASGEYSTTSGGRNRDTTGIDDWAGGDEASTS